MAQFERWFTQDLAQRIEVRHCENIVFSADNLSTLVGVNVYQGGESAALSGTVVCYAIRADGNTVEFAGDLSGNAVSAALPQSCFVAQGPLAVMLQLITGTGDDAQKTTLLKAIFSVELSSTGAIIDPGHVVPDLADIIAMMDQMEQATEAANSAAASAAAAAGYVAPVEATSTASAAYAVGKYFIYNGELYAATAAIAQGGTITPGTNCETVPGGLGGEVGELKSTIDEILDIETIPSKNINMTPYPSSGTVSDVTFTHNNDGSISLTGNPSAVARWPVKDTNIFWKLPAGTYTLSGGRAKITVDLIMYANKTDSSSSLSKSSGTETVTFTTTQDYWAFIRLTVTSSATSDGVTMYPQLEAGSEATAYQDPNYVAYISQTIRDITNDIDELENAVSNYDTEISTLNDNVNSVVTYEVGKNLVNPDTMETGGLQSSGSISTSGSWATYKTSAFIAIDENTNYVFSVFNTSTVNPVSTARVLALQYDENKAVISGTYQNVDNVGTIAISTVNTAKYVRVCSIGTYKFQLESGQNYTDFEAYSGKNVSALPLGSIPMAQSQAGNVLYGKKWAVCGDSFTDGADTGTIADGKYKGRRIVYPYIIGNRNDMEIVKFFNGGETLAFPATPGTFTNSLTNPSGSRYYQNIPADVDYITIYLGINDANHASGSSIDGEETTGEIPLGEITDNTTATYYGAWNVVLTWLITNRPNAHIGIIVTNGNASNDNYRLAQIAIAGKYGIPYIDLNGDARTPAMIRTSNPNIASAVKTALITKWRVSSDNTHPNDAAHLFESTFIENFLRSI